MTSVHWSLRCAAWSAGRRGWTVSVDRELVTFARLVARRDEEAVEVDLAVDSPPLFPIETVEGLPVLASQDLAVRKVLR